jgi:hypothetical protein
MRTRWMPWRHCSLHCLASEPHARLVSAGAPLFCLCGGRLGPDTVSSGRAPAEQQRLQQRQRQHQHQQQGSDAATSQSPSAVVTEPQDDHRRPSAAVPVPADMMPTTLCRRPTVWHVERMICTIHRVLACCKWARRVAGARGAGVAV